MPRGWFPLLVNEGSSLTNVNETTSFIKTIVFKKRTFKKKMIASNSIFRRRFHNETIVLKKMKMLTSLDTVLSSFKSFYNTNIVNLKQQFIRV